MISMVIVVVRKNVSTNARKYLIDVVIVMINITATVMINIIVTVMIDMINVDV